MQPYTMLKGRSNALCTEIPQALFSSAQCSVAMADFPQEASEKLEARCRDLEAASLLKRSSMAIDSLAQDGDQPLSPQAEPSGGSAGQNGR